MNFKKLISERTTLDTVFERACIPAMITYESKSVAEHERATEEFGAALNKEMSEIYERFSAKDLPEIRIHLFLVPLHKKQPLVDLLHRKLEGLQA